MKTPDAGQIKVILRQLNWTGHVELGENDLDWLAQELALAFDVDKGTVDLCEVCDEIKPIVVRTPLGRICEDCLDIMIEEAEESREVLEDDIE